MHVSRLACSCRVGVRGICELSWASQQTLNCQHTCQLRVAARAVRVITSWSLRSFSLPPPPPLSPHAEVQLSPGMSEQFWRGGPEAKTSAEGVCDTTGLLDVSYCWSTNKFMSLGLWSGRAFSCAGGPVSMKRISQMQRADFKVHWIVYVTQ